MASPVFLPKVPHRNPRTECGCQPVASISSLAVAPRQRQIHAGHIRGFEFPRLPGVAPNVSTYLLLVASTCETFPRENLDVRGLSFFDHTFRSRTFNPTWLTRNLHCPRLDRPSSSTIGETGHFQLEAAMTFKRCRNAGEHESETHFQVAEAPTTSQSRSRKLNENKERHVG